MSVQEFYHENRAPGVIPKDLLDNDLPNLPECPNITIIKEASPWTEVHTDGHFCGIRYTYGHDYAGGAPRQRVTSTRIDVACERIAQRLQSRLDHNFLLHDQVGQIQDYLAKLKKACEVCPQKPKPFICKGSGVSKGIVIPNVVRNLPRPWKILRYAQDD